MNFLFLGGCGVKSTVVDMSRFGQMYLDEGVFDSRRILSKASVRTLTANHNTGLPLAYHNGGIFDPAWGLGWNMGSKKDDAGMLRSASSFEHGGFGCVKLLCDPQVDIVAAFFTVSIEDNYPYSALRIPRFNIAFFTMNHGCKLYWNQH